MMDRIAYLKGLLDGQEIDKTSKEGKVLFAICDALDEMVKYTEELEDRVAELEELCDILDEDLGDMEELLLDDDDDDDECGCNFEDLYDDDEDEQYETVCPTCGKCILLDERTLEEGETVCPNCGEELEFDFDEREIEALTADLPTEE
ncbi:MAG: hypothetical protein IJ906_01765 [Oscillospiraceae bacterium]|nr:hypothetical protein [Oscillospiraceae bacterium]